MNILELCASVGVNRSTFYRHLKANGYNKDELRDTDGNIKPEYIPVLCAMFDKVGTAKPTATESGAAQLTASQASETTAQQAKPIITAAVQHTDSEAVELLKAQHAADLLRVEHETALLKAQHEAEVLRAQLEAEREQAALLRSELEAWKAQAAAANRLLAAATEQQSEERPVLQSERESLFKRLFRRSKG